MCHLCHNRIYVAEPAVDACLAEEHTGVYEPWRAVAQETELPFDAGVGEWLQIRNPEFDGQVGEKPEQGDPAEGDTPAECVAGPGRDRHTEDVGHGHASYHHGNGLCPVAFVGEA